MDSQIMTVSSRGKHLRDEVEEKHPIDAVWEARSQGHAHARAG